LHQIRNVERIDGEKERLLKLTTILFAATLPEKFWGFRFREVSPLIF